MTTALKIITANDSKCSQNCVTRMLNKYLDSKTEYSKTDNFDNDPSSPLVVLIDASYTFNCFQTIVDRLKFIFHEKLAGKKIHLICLVEEHKTQLNDLISRDTSTYTNSDIAYSLLLLEYMKSNNALTIYNTYSNDLLIDLSSLLERISKEPFLKICSLDGFFNLAQCFEKIVNSTPGFYRNNPKTDALQRLLEAHRNNKLGIPELGGHDARGQLDRHFSTYTSKSEIKNTNIGYKFKISNDARNMFKTFLIRDFIENIKQNTYNKISDQEIDILIIDDNPEAFKSDLEHLINCWPKGKVKISITKKYEFFLSIKLSNPETFPITQIPSSGEKQFVSIRDYFKKQTPKSHHFVFVDLLLGKENKGLNVVRNLIRFRNDYPDFNYDVFLFSRSTNTNDIQTALNEGACGYLFKNRIFSIPHRISEILLQKELKENDDLDYISPFSMLTKLPLKEIRKLKTTDFKPDTENMEFIRKIPKADLHCHIGGSMDVKITLELAVNILREMLLSYALASVFSGCDIQFYQNDIVESNKIGNNRIGDDLNKLFESNEKNNDKLFKRLLFLIKNVSKRIKLEIDNSDSPDVESQIIEISNIISGIKKYQVICFILFRLAFEYKQNFKSKNGFNLFDFSNFDPNSDSFSFKSYITTIIKAENVTIENINPELEKLIIAPKTNFPKRGGMGLSKYLKGSLFTGSVVLQTKENLEKIADYICEKSIKDEVWYREIKVTPEGNTRGGLSENEVIEIYKNAFSNSSKKKNGLPIIKLIIAGKRHGEIKALDRNIRLVLRDSAKNSSANAQSSHKNENKDEDYLFENSTEICGFDLVGEEIFYDPKNFRDSFKRLFETCIPLTIHAGEETDASKIWQAVYELNADRIGHGLSLGELDSNSMKLLKRFSDHKVCIELCPKSNYLTKGFNYFNNETRVYPLKQFIKNKLQITINTDDPAFSGHYINRNIEICEETANKYQYFDYWLSEEYLFATELFKSSFPKKPEGSGNLEEGRYLSQWEVLKIVKMGFKHSFLDIKSKNDLIRKVDEKIFDIIVQNKKPSMD